MIILLALAQAELPRIPPVPQAPVRKNVPAVDFVCSADREGSKKESLAGRFGPIEASDPHPHPTLDIKVDESGRFKGQEPSTDYSIYDGSYSFYVKNGDQSYSVKMHFYYPGMSGQMEVRTYPNTLNSYYGECNVLPSQSAERG